PGPGSSLHSGLRVPDAPLLEQRQHVVAEIRELFGVIEERQRGAAESGFVQLNDALGNVLGGPDQGKAPMAGGEPFANQGQQIMREGLGMSELQTNEIVDRSPVGIVLQQLPALFGL